MISVGGYRFDWMSRRTLHSRLTRFPQLLAKPFDTIDPIFLACLSQQHTQLLDHVAEHASVDGERHVNYPMVRNAPSANILNHRCEVLDVVRDEQSSFFKSEAQEAWIGCPPESEFGIYSTYVAAILD
jgi:hypothetical protein